LDSVTEGQIQVAGDLIHNWNEDKLAKWRSTKIGIIYQNFQLMPTLSLLANVELPIDFNHKYSRTFAREKAKNLLDQVGLIDHIRKVPTAISGGQQQRVAIARALANDPELILADEPTGRLDSSTAKSIFAIFEELIAHGKTILMVTHDNSLISRFSRVIWMEDGLIA
jgi:putative ABC transport system ATP-binding protein